MPIDLRRARPNRTRALGFLLGGLALLMVVLTVMVGTGFVPLVDLDESVAQAAYDVSVGHPTWIAILEAVAFWLGPWAMRGVLLVVAVVTFVRGDRRISLWLVTVVVVELVVAPLSKFILDRPRPSWPVPLTQIGEFSFPSGHAAAAGMFTTTLVLLTIVLTQKGGVRRLLLTGWVGFALLVGADRMFLGVHYLSDVVAGLALGTFVALAAWVGTMWNAVAETPPAAVTTGSGGKQLAVVLNPIKVGDVASFTARLTAWARLADWHEIRWYETTADDPGVSMAEQALSDGADLVIVAGGDGTVRTVCHELARTGVAVGVVPLGTGNLLARNLGIPLHVGDAIDVALNGQDRAIDLVALEGDGLEPTEFTVMAGLGLDAAIMNATDDDLKKRVGWVAYVVSGFQQFVRYPATRVEISVDDGPFVKHRARTVVIGNVGHLQGGLPLMPDAEVDDGLLDVVVISPVRLTGWVRVAYRVIGKRPRTDGRLDRMTGRTVVLRADRPTARQLDGDPAGEGTELRAEIQPGVLLIRVPQDAARA
ncbi:MAG: diacylglycerol kinase family protein [Nocardioidaceae bacterium]|nr:diacylglycerol kinase family protein [Nocardioidaceae bacterium]